MTKTSEAISKKGRDRRDFLKMAALSAPAAVAAAGAMGAEAEAATPDLTSQTMQDTEHTRAERSPGPGPAAGRQADGEARGGQHGYKGGRIDTDDTGDAEEEEDLEGDAYRRADEGDDGLGHTGPFHSLGDEARQPVDDLNAYHQQQDGEGELGRVFHDHFGELAHPAGQFSGVDIHGLSVGWRKNRKDFRSGSRKLRKKAGRGLPSPGRASAGAV